MLKVTDVEPSVIHVLDQKELQYLLTPDEFDAAYDFCLELSHEDLLDGDFRCRLNLDPSAEVYFPKDATWFFKMKQNLPGHVLSTNKFAINFYQ